MASSGKKWLALASKPFRAIGPGLKRGWAWAKEHRGRLARVSAHVGLAGSLAFLVILVHRSIFNVVTQSPRYRVPEASARAVVSPAWTDPRGAEGVVTIPAEHSSLFDEGLVARVARSFGENPWVRKVTAVDRVFPDQVRVRFELREPRLAVRKGSGAVLVDRDGVRLPGLYSTLPAGALEVSGVASAAPASGAKWEAPEIAAALEMASLAEGEELLRRLGVRAVDVSNLNGRKNPRDAEVCLQAASGAWVAWGRVPSSARFGEPCLSEKLDNLRLAAENYPNLEGLASVKIHVKGSPRCLPAESGLGKKTRK